MRKNSKETHDCGQLLLVHLGEVHLDALEVAALSQADLADDHH